MACELLLSTWVSAALTISAVAMDE